MNKINYIREKQTYVEWQREKRICMLNSRADASVVDSWAFLTHLSFSLLSIKHPGPFVWMPMCVIASLPASVCESPLPANVLDVDCWPLSWDHWPSSHCATALKSFSHFTALSSQEAYLEFYACCLCQLQGE